MAKAAPHARFVRPATLLMPIAAFFALSDAVSAAPLLSSHVGGVLFRGPAEPHVTAIYHNPAALSLATGTQFYASGGLRLDRGSISRKAIDPMTGEPGGQAATRSISDSTISFDTYEGFAGISSNFGRLTFGVAAFNPNVETGHFDENSSARYHRLALDWRETEISLAIGARITNRIRAGLGLSLVTTNVRYAFMRDTALEGGMAAITSPCGDSPVCGVENPNAAQKIDIETAADALTFSLGLMMEIKSGWWLGVAYHPALSPRGFNTEGSVSVSGAGISGTARGQASLLTDMPHRLAAALTVPLTAKLRGVLSSGWVGWDLHREFDLRLTGGQLRAAGVPERIVHQRKFEDTYYGELGLDYRRSNQLRLGVAARAEFGVNLPEDVTPAALDAPKGEIDGALEWTTGKLTISLGYGLTAHLPRDVSPGANHPINTIECVDSGFDLDACEALRLGLARTSADGNYFWLTHHFSAGIGYKF